MEPTLRLTVGARDMAATRATLRRIAGIHENNLDASRFGLVFDELLKLEERPVVQFPALLSSDLDPLTDVRQIFHCDGAAWGNGFNQEFRYPVIFVKLKPSFSSAQFFEVSFCRSSVFSLELSFEPKSLSGMLFDVLSVKELVIAGDGNAANANIDAYHIAGGGHNDIRQCHNQVNPEGAVGVKDQVAAVNACRLVQEWPEVFGEREGNVEPPSRGRDTDLAVIQEDAAGSVIITNGLGAIGLGAGNLFTLLFTGESRFHSFAGLLSGRDHQLRRQSWVDSPEGEIGFMVKCHTVDNFRLPCNAGNLVEAGRVVDEGVQEDIFLDVVD